MRWGWRVRGDEVGGWRVEVGVSGGEQGEVEWRVGEK